MTELWRRDQPNLVPHTPHAPARRDRTPAKPAGVTRVTWGDEVERIGWDHMPEPALDALARAGLPLADPVAVWAEPAKVRDRGPAGYTQDIEGWWADPDRLVSIQARRPLARDAGTNSFRPTSGPWSVSAILYPITGQARTQRWNKPLTPATGGQIVAEPEARYAHIREVLPAAIRDQLGQPTQSGSARYQPDGGYHEHFVAYRRTSNQIVVVSADRRAGTWPDPQAALDAAPWITTVIDGTISTPRSYET